MSSPMIVWVPLVNRIYSYLTADRSKALQSIDLPSVEIHNIESAQEKRPRTLRHLLKANHINSALFYHDDRFVNHVAHFVSSAYLLGATTNQLHQIYTSETKEQAPWRDSPGEVSDMDWRDFLGDKDYQRAFLDFFEDELALKYQYDWKQVVEKYLFTGPNPLISCMIPDLGHQIIHLGYAYEMNSREIAMEALAMTATGYNELHKYIDDPSYTKPSENPSASVIELLHRISTDKRLDGVFDHKEGEDLSSTTIARKIEPMLLDHWNAWSITNPAKQFEESQRAVIAAVVSVNPEYEEPHDLILVHLLTSSHAVRILLPMIPGKYHIIIVKQWWMFAIISYVGQLRPKFNEKLIEEYDLKDRNWDYAIDKALNGDFKLDVHFGKAIRAMKVAGETWGDPDSWYLKSATKFAEEFRGWGTS